MVPTLTRQTTRVPLRKPSEDVCLPTDGPSWIDPGGTPLHYACRVGNKEVALLLLQKGANYKARDSDRLTPIYQASFFGHAEIVKMLLQYYSSEQKGKRNAPKEPTGCDNIQVRPLLSFLQY